VSEVRVTAAVAILLQKFLEDVAQPRYGYELMQMTQYPSGKVYPILAPLQKAGWLVRERDVTGDGGGPNRRLYRLEPSAVERVRYEVAAISEQLRPADRRDVRRPRPETGTT
jgi:PadR family transcriptional regulator